MRVLRACTATGALALLMLSALGISATAAPDPAKKGILIIRSGATTTAGGYQDQIPDPNGKLYDLSVQCSNDVPYVPGVLDEKTLKALNATSSRYRTYGTTNSTTIWQWGRVDRTPQPGNKQHCSISGLTVSQLRAAFIQQR